MSTGKPVISAVIPASSVAATSYGIEFETMTWQDKVYEWIDSKAMPEHNVSAFAAACDVPQSTLDAQLKNPGGFLDVPNTRKVALFMGITMDQLTDESLGWPVPTDRVEKNLDWNAPEAVKATEDLVARALHKAAHGLEK